MQQEIAQIVSIGDRIRAERQRRGWSQAQLAERGNASRRAVTEWEKGGSMPNAAVLAAWAEAGFDVVYVLTGRRNLTVEQATSALDAAEATADAQGASHLRAVVEGIATSDNLPDRLRARADQLLRWKFADEQSEIRQQERSRRQHEDRRRAEVLVEDACADVGWRPPASLLGHLIALVRVYSVDSATIGQIAYDLKRLLDAR